MTKDAWMVLFALVVVGGCVSVPLISTLIKHQQTMARILRNNGRSDQVEDQLESMRNEILQLNATVGALKALLTSGQDQENGKKLANRLGGSA